MSTTFTVSPATSPRSDQERADILAAPGFGRYFTDHLVRIRWSLQRGWYDCQVRPYGPLQLDPAASVLHYGQAVFEGIKAYRHADGSIWTFRPQANGRRLQESARRVALPELPVDMFVDALRALIAIDHAWVPSAPGTSLYFRPFMIGTEAFIGVQSAKAVDFYLIASPAAAYFQQGFHPVAIWVSTEYTRAAPGGTGAAKCGGNYAASLLPQQLAKAQGCAQVLFLDAVHRRYVEELGGMNVFFVYEEGRLVTPALTGTILPGITRSSIIQLAQDRGLIIEEKAVALADVCEGLQSGAISEVFACGTAAVITPIQCFKNEHFCVGDPDASPGPVTTSLHAELSNIYYGHQADRHRWMRCLRSGTGMASG